MSENVTFDFELASHVRPDKTQFILIRITKNGKLKRVTTGIAVHKDFWNKQKKEVRRNHLDWFNLNQKLADKKNEIENAYRGLVENSSNNVLLDIKTIQARIKNKTEPKITKTLAYYRLFLDQHIQKIAKNTIISWRSRLNKLESYIKQELKTNDIELVEINAAFGRNYYNWFLASGFGKSHAHRAVGSLRQVLVEAENNGLIEKNPLNNLKLEKSKPKPIVYLTIEEIELLGRCPFYDDRLQKVADSFILQCFTGMAYNELLNFDAKKHLITDANNSKWIFIDRGKTGKSCRIPIFPEAEKILEKYQNKPPVISNDKMNKYLKEVGQVAGLTNPDRLTTHVGRKTAATYLINKGVSLLVASKILGNSVKVLEQRYAHLQNDFIYESVKGLM